MTMTTDEWTEAYFAKFARDVEATLKCRVRLDADKAYSVRRMIMQVLRNGESDLAKLTAEVEQARALRADIEELCATWRKRADVEDARQRLHPYNGGEGGDKIDTCADEVEEKMAGHA